MSKIDKRIKELGYSIHTIDHDMDLLESNGYAPIIDIEYVRKSSNLYRADNTVVTLTDKIFVYIFLTSYKTLEYGIKVSYEADKGPAALGGDREYGTTIRSMPISELEIFLKEAKRLQRRYRRRVKLQKLFKRG